MLNEAAEKQLADAIRVNSLLPHLLASAGGTYGYRLIHISTDCVFSGARGSYTEADVPDGTSAYAR
ncbi:sugar nucleotide-binding protein, partial [Acinetobacter baumannii]|uniref:sugar nucleotide-binding protein n=1 Tax=Acinetobacter baumannii TaxID=470 RepID=UPI001969AE09